MGISLIVAIVASFLAMLGLGATAYLYWFSLPDDVKEWAKEVDFDETPQAPIFNDDDSQECRDLINQFYTDSSESWLETKNNDLLFQGIYASILDLKAQYDVKFVGEDSVDGNAEFRDWVLGSDWYDFNAQDTVVPQFDDAMEVKFGADAIAITDADQLEEAAWALVQYREGYGLESLTYYDEPHYTFETFQECTIPTQIIGIAYAEYLVRYCCDARPDNLTTFMERLGQFVLDQAD